MRACQVLRPRRVAQALALSALGHIAFRYTDSVGTRNQFSIAAQWLACTFPYRRFADILADACARLGADVVRYSFIAVDLHHLLLAGLPAHLCKNATTRDSDRINDAPSYRVIQNDSQAPPISVDLGQSATCGSVRAMSVLTNSRHW